MSMKVNIFFYKNSGIETYNSLYTSAKIFQDCFPKLNFEYKLNNLRTVIVYESNENYIFMRFSLEKQNDNPLLKIKDLNDSKIIEEPLFIYNAFLLINHTNNYAAFIGDKTVIGQLQQYILENTSLAISDKQISFGPLSINEEEKKDTN